MDEVKPSHSNIKMTVPSLLSFLTHNFPFPDLSSIAWALVALVAAIAVGAPSIPDPVISRECIFAAVVCFLVLRKHGSRSQAVYLVDFACFRPPDILRIPHTTFLEHCKLSDIFTQQSVEFQKKVLEASGLGPATYFPMCLHQLPPKPSLAAAREESELVLSSCMAELLKKTKVLPKDISILVVNCSTFNPTPCLSSMIVNKFKLKSNVRTYNLGGMGCSAGVIALDLAKDALQVYTGTYAVVLSTENITRSFYLGNDKSMLVNNCVSRVGGAALLLSNKSSDKWHAKYRLEHVVRTHKGADDVAYRAAYENEDAKGNVGFGSSKDFIRVAVETLRLNIAALGPLVLPYSEQLFFLTNYLKRTVLKVDLPPYAPNFRNTVKHFCIESADRAVIAAVEKALNLTPVDVEPAKMALHRCGNTSASSMWYQFQYLETKGRIKKGDKICQVAFGSGFKCNSAVWTALCNIHSFDSPNAWTDTILDYPVVIPEMQHI